MNIPPTPDFINKVQELYQKAHEYGGKLGEKFYVNIDTMKLIKSQRTHTAGIFTTNENNKELVQWCDQHIGWDPLNDTVAVDTINGDYFWVNRYNADPTPGLFRDGSNERILQVMQVMWNRLNTLETENKELREKVRCMTRPVDRDD